MQDNEFMKYSGGGARLFKTMFDLLLASAASSFCPVCLSQRPCGSSPPTINTSPCLALSFPSFVLLSSRSASRHFHWASPAACDCLTLGFQINMLNISSATPLYYHPDTCAPAPPFLTCCTARAPRYDRPTILLLFFLPREAVLTMYGAKLWVFY